MIRWNDVHIHYETPLVQTPEWGNLCIQDTLKCPKHYLHNYRNKDTSQLRTLFMVQNRRITCLHVPTHTHTALLLLPWVEPIFCTWKEPKRWVCHCCWASAARRGGLNSHDTTDTTAIEASSRAITHRSSLISTSGGNLQTYFHGTPTYTGCRCVGRKKEGAEWSYDWKWSGYH